MEGAASSASNAVWGQGCGTERSQGCAQSAWGHGGCLNCRAVVGIWGIPAPGLIGAKAQRCPGVLRSGLQAAGCGWTADQGWSPQSLGIFFLSTYYVPGTCEALDAAEE